MMRRGGSPTGAAAAFADLLADMERLLGPDHHRTLTTRHEHARWRGEAGETARAAEHFANVLADRLRAPTTPKPAPPGASSPTGRGRRRVAPSGPPDLGGHATTGRAGGRLPERTAPDRAGHH